MAFFSAALRYASTRGVTVCGRGRGRFAWFGGGYGFGIHDLVAIYHNGWRARLIDSDFRLSDGQVNRQRHANKADTDSPQSFKKSQMVYQHGQGVLLSCDDRTVG